MAGDLATALAAGNAPPGFAGDPALAQIAPQLQLASLLAQQGMSGAPASPWQAAGRLGSSLAGALIQGDAQNELRHLYTGASDEMGKIFPAGTPQGDAVRSKSPLVRMLAAQNFPKQLLLSGETKVLGPEQGLVAPGVTPPGGGVVGINSMAPRQAGAVESAKAAAKAPYEGGGEGVVQTANGPQTIPITAATRAAMQPKPVQTVPAGTYDRETGRVSLGVGGKPEGQGQLYGAASEALGKVIGEHIEAGGKAARDKLNALDSMESALATGGKGIITGPNAEFALKAKQALNGMGISADWIDKGLPETEIISKMNAQLASASAKAMTGRPTQNEFNIWMRNNPGIATSKEGTKALIGILRQQTNNDIELGRLAQKRSNWENWGETVDKFYEGHGLKDPLTGKPMRDEIAAAHGGRVPGASPNPNEITAKAVPGIGQVVRGHRYIGGDPKAQTSWEPVK